jgi:hypothetical protein
MALYRVAAPLPGPVRRQLVVAQRTTQLTPIAYASATVRAKSADVRATVEGCEAGLVPVSVLSHILNGTIAAAVSGGVARLQTAFLSGQPSDGDGVALLRESLVAQVCVLRHGC